MTSGEKGKCASDETLRLGWAIEPDELDGTGRASSKIPANVTR